MRVRKCGKAKIICVNERPPTSKTTLRGEKDHACLSLPKTKEKQNPMI